MRVLIATASRHGSTTDIGDEIARVITAAGHEVVHREAAEVSSIDAFDAVIVGSAIYAGRWIAEATRLIEKQRGALLARPTWLFSSGPIGEPLVPAADPPVVAELVAQIEARGHVLFAGNLDKSRLGVGERLIVGLLKADTGDFRDWEAVRAWANEIASELTAIRERVAAPAAG